MTWRVSAARASSAAFLPGPGPGAGASPAPSRRRRGPNWLTAADERGHRRLDDPDDFVRLEIEAALTRGARVIPVLAEGAVVPRRQDLPESLAGLARRNALLIRHESFRSDAGRLVTAIERLLAPARGAAAVSGIPV
jgi:hypothetical protein